MGWLFGKSESVPVDEVLRGMTDKQIEKMIKTKKGVPNLTAKQLREAAKADRRRLQGERGIAALIDGFSGGGTRDQRYQSLPLKDRVHPAEYRRILQREAKRQGLL